MRIFALELNNDIKGLDERKEYIESLISKLPFPDLVLLPELAICSYMPNLKVWQYADYSSEDTSKWAREIAAKYNTYIGIGYLDYENGDFYNRYMIADGKQVYGIVTKSEGEAAVFKRGKYNSIIRTPFGNVAIAICYDSRRKHFYENIKDKKISLIVFPHGSPADFKNDLKESKANDYFCNLYSDAFDVPVVYVNSIGKLEYMSGIMGFLMRLSSFRMNGKTMIYTSFGKSISCEIKEAVAFDISLSEQEKKKDIIFHGDDLIKDNILFRNIILKPDIYFGLKKYNRNKKKYGRSVPN